MLLKLNGKLIYCNRTKSIKKLSKGKYTVAHDCGIFTIEGGRPSGATQKDWFITGPHIRDYIHCNSVREALHILDHL